MAHPVGPRLAQRLVEAAEAEGVAHRRGGTYVCMEGPQFSSYAESTTYRHLGYDVIGMTAMPEAKLAKEAEITYATLAMVTDFDCWHPDHDAVDVASVIAVMNGNIEKARRIVARVAREFPGGARGLPGGLAPGAGQRHHDRALRAGPRTAGQAGCGGGEGAQRCLSNASAPLSAAGEA